MRGYTDIDFSAEPSELERLEHKNYDVVIG
jgi:hypothetical protein